MEGVIVFISMCATVFGSYYYYLFTRNKERMALIESGADASLFQAEPSKRKRHPAYSIALVIGMMAMGVGFGLLLAVIIQQTMDIHRSMEAALYMSNIFLFGGLGLVTSFLTLRKLDKADEKK